MSGGKIVQFRNPYQPNDGHGPGVPMRDWIYTYMLMLDGTKADLGSVLSILNENGDGEHGDACLKFDDGGGYIRITEVAGDPYPIHHWQGIGYEVITELPEEKTNA